MAHSSTALIQLPGLAVAACSNMPTAERIGDVCCVAAVVHVRMELIVALRGRGRARTRRGRSRSPTIGRQDLDVRAAAVPEFGEVPVPEQSVHSWLCAARHLNVGVRLWPAI